MQNLFGDNIGEVVEVEEEEFKRPPVPKLFDWLGSINETKVDMRIKNPELRGYEPYIINKGLGQSKGTVEIANLLNRLPHIPKEQHYALLYHAIPKHKAYVKWAKAKKFDNLKEVMAKLGYSEEKAKEAIEVLGDEGVKQLLFVKGGSVKRVRKKK